jgi:hypothetical protein
MVSVCNGWIQSLFGWFWVSRPLFNGYLLVITLGSKKNDIWRRGTGEKYKENIFKLKVNVSYDSGYGTAFDEIIRILEDDKELFDIIVSCNYAELQVIVSTDDDLRVPQIQLTPKQMEYFGQRGIALEININ